MQSETINQWENWNEDHFVRHLESLRWANDIASPFDQYSKVYKCSQDRYRCRNTGKYFNVRTNTIFHGSKIPLKKWFEAIDIVNKHPEITSTGLAASLELSTKSAWSMLKKLKIRRSANRMVVPAEEFQPDLLSMTNWLKQL